MNDKTRMDNEIIIQFADPVGEIHTQRLHTAEGTRHPKRVVEFLCGSGRKIGMGK